MLALHPLHRQTRTVGARSLTQVAPSRVTELQSPARFYLFVKNIVTMERRSIAQEAFQAPSMKDEDLSPSYISQGRRKPLLATTLWSRQVILRFFSVNNSGLRKGLLCRMIRSCQESYRDQASKDTWSSRHHHEDDIWLESSSVQHSTQQKEAKSFESIMRAGGPNPMKTT